MSALTQVFIDDNSNESKNTKAVKSRLPGGAMTERNGNVQGKKGQRKRKMPHYMNPTKAAMTKKNERVKNKKISNAARKKMRLTVPKSPALNTRFRKREIKVKNEVQQLKEYEEERKRTQVKQFRQMKNALAPKANTGAVRSNKALTMPEPFNLESGNRPRAFLKQLATAQEPQVERPKVDTTKTLTLPQAPKLATAARAKMSDSTDVPKKWKSRAELINEFQTKTPDRFHTKSKHEDVPVLPSPVGGLTIPEEFKMNHSIKETVRSETEFIPMCLKVAEFHTKTPDRFRSVPAGTGPVLPPPITESLTNPEAPHFATDERMCIRPAAVSTEDKTIAYMKEHEFKAKPVDSRVLNSCGDLGVPKLVPKESTIPEPFKISKTNRSQKVVQEPNNVQSFKANPVNKAMLDHALFRPKQCEKALTEATSPTFQTATRAAIHQNRSTQETECDTQFVAKPAPDMTYPRFITQPSTKALTEVVPFNLESETRHHLYQMKHQEKLQQEQDTMKEQREFIAKPIVHYFPEHNLNKVEERPLTEVQAFNFEGEHFADEAQRQFQQRIAAKEKEAKQNREFKAMPMPNMNKKFEIAASEKELTNAIAPTLNTEERAENRAEFDQMNQERLRKEKQQALQNMRIKAEKEAEEIKKLRKQMEFKAKPIKRGRPIQVKKSTKALTVSYSPSFGSRSKTRSSS